jgi:hypothetical protein
MNKEMLVFLLLLLMILVNHRLFAAQVLLENVTNEPALVRDEPNGDWSAQEEILFNTSEAEVMVRVGDIDNLGFGWPNGFDPFSGNSTPVHSFPWSVDPTDFEGTDRIMVVTSYAGTPPHGRDGYTTSTSRPENLPRAIELTYTLGSVTVNSASLQIFVDDFQAPVWWADYEVYINGVRAEFIEPLINSLSQTGPIGKLITVTIPNEFLGFIETGTFSILFDDNATGAGDGYAIDFVKLLINPGNYSYTGTIQGTVTDLSTSLPVEDVTIIAASTISDTTDEFGFYQLTSVPAGYVYVEASKAGYVSQSTFVNLIANGTETLHFQLQKKPDVPENITIEVINDTTFVTWSPVTGATSYKIYAADSPNDTFIEDTGGTFVNESWSKPITDNLKFYKVTAIK